MREIYYNGVIYTGTGRDAEAMAVEDGRIAGVGTLTDVEGQTGEGSPADTVSRGSEGSRQVNGLRTAVEYMAGDNNVIYHDLKGHFVVPGFHDSHMHLLNYGYTLKLVDLTAATSSLKAVCSALSDYITKEKPAFHTWIVGRGWNHDYFQDEKRFPDRRDLDQVSTEHPILVIRACGHIACANTKAMENAGITRLTPQPEGGCYDIGEDGNPNGIFREFGVDLICGAVTKPSGDELKQYIRRAMKDLNSRGITSVQTDDLGAFSGIPFEMVIEAYKELEQDGEMTVRVYEQCLLPSMKQLKDFLVCGYRTGQGTAYFKLGPLKLLADGSLGARTAFLSRPYEDAEKPGEKGFAVYTQEELEELIITADRAGMQIAVHAIGDGAMEMVVRAYERAMVVNPGREDRRHGIVHCQITTAELLEAFRRLKLHAYIQSIFLDYDSHIVEMRVGAERAKETYQFKTLLSMGVSVSNGSDCPVERPDVMAGIQCAVTRTTLDGTKTFLEEQALTVEEAIATYTAMGAQASFEEQEKGRLAVGMVADFAILEHDLRACRPDRIKDTAILETYAGGVCVYRKEKSQEA